jgi:3,4-dihydroxybenzoyl-citryl-spermidine/N-citryl-spermidine--spermidine ligase
MTTPATDDYGRDPKHGAARARHAEAVRASDAEQRVVRQLVEALLFEGLVPYRTQARAAHDRAHEFERVCDRTVSFEIGPHRFRCLGAIRAFDRVRIAQGSVDRLSAAAPRAVSLSELVASLDIAPEARRRLLTELEQTVVVCQWNRDNLTHQHAPRRGLAFQELESAIVEGHPYHPCFKTRTGFTLDDHRSYGFEAGNTFQLEWLAVARSSLRIALPSDEVAFWTRELGERAYALLTARLAERGGDWERYALLPVHPWQLGAIRGPLAPDIAKRAVLLLGVAGDLYRATQSLRTLVNAVHPHKANVKLPLDIVCTSTDRNFRTNFVCTAPVLSDWLASMVEADPLLQRGQRLVLLREYAGITYESENEALAGRLGVIFRESVCTKLEPGEQAVPLTAITAVESDGRPFIAPWLDEHGVRRWSERLVEVMVLPIWHMLVHHGVAFESHAQNLVLVHRGGWPEKIVLRDFHEDTEFVLDYLRTPQTVPNFAAVDPFFETVADDEGYRMASVDALRELFMDCVYVYNLADIAFLLERFCAHPEADFWEVVRARLRDYEQAGVTDKARIERVAADRPRIVVESLLTKKIRRGAKLDFFEHPIRNTLHG